MLLTFFITNQKARPLSVLVLCADSLLIFQYLVCNWWNEHIFYSLCPPNKITSNWKLPWNPSTYRYQEHTEKFWGLWDIILARARPIIIMEINQTKIRGNNWFSRIEKIEWEKMTILEFAENYKREWRRMWGVFLTFDKDLWLGWFVRLCSWCVLFACIRKLRFYSPRSPKTFIFSPTTTWLKH